MTNFPWDLVGLAGLLAVNRLGLKAAIARPSLFWGLQGLNLAGAGAALVWGMPGLSAYPQVSWLVAGLLAFHVFQNLALRAQALTHAERDAGERERWRKLRALDAPPAAPPSDPPDDPASR
jgi:hypothetical protein